MNREIKFRGKDIKGNWRYGDLMTLEHFISNSEGKYQIGDFNTGVVYEVDPETIGQYTGLKDKNGKEIYEGDIVSYKDRIMNKEDIFVIKYCEERASFILSNKMYEEMTINVKNKIIVAEVIGNTTDNPELFEEGTENE